MRKTLLCLSFLCVFCGLWCVANAEECTSGAYTYILLEDGDVEITQYIGWESDLTVPEIIDGRKVTGIGDAAFKNCGNLRSVTIPESVTVVGNNPFLFNENLSEVIVSRDHPALATIEGVLFSKMDRRLIWCSPQKKSQEYSIPQGIKDIGDYAFMDCHGIKNVMIPDSVTSIGNYAFKNCDKLNNITMPDSITRIGDGAFAFCTGLKNMTIPDSVISVGMNPFAACGFRIDMIVSPDHPILSVIDGVLFSKNDARLIHYPLIKSDKEYVVPWGIKSIDEYAFYRSLYLQRVAIPDTVTSIGGFAFAECQKLIDVTIPDSVKDMGKYAFYYAQELTNVTIPKGVTCIEEYTFSECKSLKSITIPDGITSIGESAFSGCHSLTNLMIPEGITIINRYTFEECYRLKSIVIPDGVTSIGRCAFFMCSDLTSVIIPDSVTSIDGFAFSKCYALASLKIPGSVISMDEDTFRFSNNITLMVPRGGYAEQFCKENELSFMYDDELDWLND